MFELVIAIFVVATLATLGFSHYRGYRERALDAEAQTNLGAIIGAERDFRRQSASTFYISANHALLNANLAGVMLSTAANRPWNYLTRQNAANNVCCAQATRTVAPVRNWRLCTNGNQPVAGTCGAAAGNCP